MNVDKKTALIGIGVTIFLAIIVIFMRNQNSASTGGNTSGGVTDLMGGFQTAGTIYVPTSSYDLQYNTYKGAVTYSTVTNNSASTTTTTYSPVNSNNNSNNNNPINSPSGSSTVSGSNVTSIVSAPPAAGVAGNPIITTGSGNTINPPTRQTNTTPAAPAPAETHTAAPAPASTVSGPKMMGTMHYAHPSGGWDPNSVVDYVKSHGGYADQASLGVYYNQSMGRSDPYRGTAAQNIQMLSAMESVYGAPIR